MINLFSYTKILTILSTIYAALMAIVFYFSEAGDLAGNIYKSFKYAAFYELFILAIFLFGWRYIWRAIPKLNSLIFPDINGTWDLEIHWKWEKDGERKEGEKTGIATIKQSFIKTSIEFETDEAESETLLVFPKRNAESGRLQLFYVYRNIPDNNTSTENNQPYMGTAILKFAQGDNSLLQGNYFTDRDTMGKFKLYAKDKNT